jgi:predicted ATPase/class 3 adenylate cyclase
VDKPSGSEQLASYYFGGPAVETAAEAEHHAQPGNLVLAPTLAVALAENIQTLPASEHGYARLLALAPGTTLPPAIELPPAETLSGQVGFIPAAILDHSRGPGEFRQVVTVFINLMGVKTHADLEPFVHAVYALQREYDGYLARINFGDKGCNLLLFWGAPTSSEDDIDRALNFTLALSEHTPGSYKAGLTFCSMYAGLVGCARRGEWTCYGYGINLAARLMSAAPWGSLWLDERLARRAGRQFVTEKIGERTFKGFDVPQAVYALLDKQSPELSNFFHGTLVGRVDELARLEEFIRPLLAPPGEQHFAGILCVEGEAGLGKSRLVTEFLLPKTSPMAERVVPLQWALCQTDATVRAPFNPWVYWLRNYFEQSPAASEARNKRAFGRVLDGLIALTIDDGLQAELNQGRSFLGALLDLSWDNSPYVSAPPQGRYELILTALTALVRAEARRCPLVINLEDIQWLDEDSLAVVARLAHAAVEAPFAILATARPVQGCQPLFGDLPYQRLELGRLAHRELEQLAQEVLGGPLEGTLAALLDQQAEGNPFFAEQILFFLREQGGLVEQGGYWRLAKKAGEAGRSLLPSDVRLIFNSRLDCLSSEVKEVVHAAAILGREFEVRVLTDMLKNKERLPTWMKEAEGSAIWTPITELRYMFKNALLRDAAYEMQLRARRRELHRLAAEALEKLYAADLASHFAEIAYHYHAAYRQGLEDVRLHAVDYLEKAGQQAAAGFENDTALQAYSDALELLEAGETDRQWSLLLQREVVYDRNGEREPQQLDLEALVALAEASQRPAERAVAALRCSRYSEAMEDYPRALAQAQAAVKLSQAAGRVDLEAEAQFHWSRSLWRQSDFPGASGQAQQGLALARAAGEAAIESSLLRLLSYIAHDQGYFAASLAYSEQALASSRASGDRSEELLALNSLSILAQTQGDLAGASQGYRQSLALARTMGERRCEALALNNLGWSLINQGDFTGALESLQKSLGLLRTIRSRAGEVDCITALAELDCCQGQLDQASKQVELALVIAQEIGIGEFAIRAHTVLGKVRLLQGRPAEAREHYEAACTGAQALAIKHLLADALAGLAQACVQLGEAAAARQALEQVLPLLAENPALAGLDRPFPPLLQICQSLLALADPRATQVLTDTYELLQARAALLSDEATRRAFLENVPEHRELCALYARVQSGGTVSSVAAPVPVLAQPSAAARSEARAVLLEEEVRAPETHLPPPATVLPSSPPAGPTGAGAASPTPTPDPEKFALAAQIAALLGESARAQGVTLIILGDIHIAHIGQVILGGPAPKEPELLKPAQNPEEPPSSN